MRIIKRQSGFTLLEVLIVVGIITILAAIVIVAINPSKMLGDARNAQRRADINTILNAVYQFAIDNNGTLPGGATLDATARQICVTVVDATNCPTATSINLQTDLVGSTAKYLASLPCDPTATCTATNSTKYTITKNATTSRITVSTTVVDGGGSQISITR